MITVRNSFHGLPLYEYGALLSGPIFAIKSHMKEQLNEFYVKKLTLKVDTCLHYISLRRITRACFRWKGLRKGTIRALLKSGIRAVFEIGFKRLFA